MTDFIVSFGIWAGVLVGSAILLGLLGLARIRAAWLVFGVVGVLTAMGIFWYGRWVLRMGKK